MSKIYIIIALFLLAQTSLLAQGWLKTYYHYQSIWDNTYGKKTADNGFVIAGHVEVGMFNCDINITKTDQFGNIQWSKTLVKGGDEYVIAINQIPSDGGYLLMYRDYYFNAYIARLDALGQLLSDIPINTGMTIVTGVTKTNAIITSDEHLLVTSNGTDTAGKSTMGLAKLDLAGNLAWTKIYHKQYHRSFAMNLLETTDGNYILAGHIDTTIAQNQGDGNELYIIKTDTSGNDLWRKTHKITNGDCSESIINTSDGGYLVAGLNNLGANTKFLLVKLDANGDKDWHWVSPLAGSGVNGAHSCMESPDGSFVGTGRRANNLELVKLNSSGTLVWQKEISTGQNIAQGRHIYSSSNGNYSIIGMDIGGMFIMTTDTGGVLYSNHIVGRYFHDLNNNCLHDVGEPALANQLIQASKVAENRFSGTNTYGFYDIEVDSGTYTVSAEPLSPYWQFCQNSQTVTFNNFYSRDTVDFAISIQDSCTYMQVDVSSPRLRRCFPAVYYVNYANWGTINAQNAYVDLTFDPYLTYDSSSIPGVLITGNTYRFYLGTVTVLNQNTFIVHVTVDCNSTVLGQVHCVEAHIYPDTICIPNYWTGPIIQASSSCTNDSITFKIENIGTSMLAPQNYSIIEEHVMIQSMPFQLGSGSDQFVTILAAPGASYRLEVAQAANYPLLLGDSIAISNVIGCNNLFTMSTPNILNQFYNGNSSPFISNDCQANRGSFDPNDKEGQPLGYDNQHYINNNIPINYKIRFQNTGTDTAFRVVVIDTLDKAFDIKSIRMGASSHAYTWHVREDGILIVTFNKIMLPDSATNELESNGFFKFEIQQKKDNPIGTVIYNKAGIYFDFNSPIITNQTFHTIGEDFIALVLTNLEEVLKKGVEIKVYPNPFEHTTNLEVLGGDFKVLELEVLNITGQVVRTVQSYNSSIIQLHRDNLAAGVYLYRIKADNELLNTGKLIVR